MRLFSQMDQQEILSEITRLEKEINRAEKKGMTSEVDLLRQKKNMARSYLVDPQKIQPGTWYKVEGTEDRFYVEYLRGVMAWGNWEGSLELVAIPIGIIRLETL